MILVTLNRASNYFPLGAGKMISPQNGSKITLIYHKTGGDAL
jgi:hypothetical protein